MVKQCVTYSVVVVVVVRYAAGGEAVCDSPSVCDGPSSRG